MERFAIKIDKNLRANLYKICRLCGIDNPDKVKVLDDETIVNLEEGEPELWKKVLDCIGLLITKDDKMPQFMCTLCVDKINDFFEFREMCYATDGQTRKLLGIKEEPKVKVTQRASTSVDCKSEDPDIKQPLQVPVVSAQRPSRKRRNADMEICDISREIKTDEADDVKPTTSNTINSASKKKRLKLDSTDTDIKPIPDTKSGSTLKLGLSKKRLKNEPSTLKEKKDIKPAKITKLMKKNLKAEASPPAAQEERKPISLQMQKKKKALELLKQRKKVAVVKVEKLRKGSVESKIKEEAPVPAPAAAPSQPKVKLKDKCAICNESFVNKALLDKHIKSTHIPNVSRYHCVQCNETLKKNMEIKNHNLWHKLSKTPFQCGNCSEFSCSIYTYSKHIRDCGQVAYIDAHIPDWHCPECSGVFETTYLFNIHSCVANTLICPGCDRSHKWKEDYFKHIPTCTAAVHRIPPYMTSNIQVKNEAENPTSPIPPHNTHVLSATTSNTVQPTPPSRITPPLMDSNQCVVIPGNVNLLEEASSPSSKSSTRKTKRITKKDLKRFDKLLKSTMTTLVSIKQEPAQGDAIADEDQSTSSDVRVTSPSPSESPTDFDVDYHHNDDDDDSGDEQTSSQPVGLIKQEIVDEGYRDLYSNIEVHIKREVVLNENRGVQEATSKKAGNSATEEVTEPIAPKPVLKLKITKEHGMLNSVLLDSPKSEKKKKKKKRKEERLKAAGKEESNVVQEITTNASDVLNVTDVLNAPDIPDVTDSVEEEPAMPLPEIIRIKKEITDQEEGEEQLLSQSSHSTPSIVAATSGALQISCVSEGVHFNGPEENDDEEEEETSEPVNDQPEQEDDQIEETVALKEAQEEMDIKPCLQDLIPMLQIASVSSGEDLMKKAAKITPKTKRRQKAVAAKPSVSTPQIVSVSSGSEVLAYQPEPEKPSEEEEETFEKVDNNENVFDYTQVRVKEEVEDPAYDQQDCEMPEEEDIEEEEEEEEKKNDEMENKITEKQAEENAYIANIDFNNLRIKQEKEYIDDGLDNPVEEDSSDTDSESSSETDDNDSESEREYRELPSEDDASQFEKAASPVVAPLGLQISTVHSEFTNPQPQLDEKTESQLGVHLGSEDKTKSNLTTDYGDLEIDGGKPTDDPMLSSLKEARETKEKLPQGNSKLPLEVDVETESMHFKDCESQAHACKTIQPVTQDEKKKHAAGESNEPSPNHDLDLRCDQATNHSTSTTTIATATIATNEMPRYEGNDVSAINNLEDQVNPSTIPRDISDLTASNTVPKSPVNEFDWCSDLERNKPIIPTVADDTKVSITGTFQEFSDLCTGDVESKPSTSAATLTQKSHQLIDATATRDVTIDDGELSTFSNELLDEIPSTADGLSTLSDEIDRIACESLLEECDISKRDGATNALICPASTAEIRYAEISNLRNVNMESSYTTNAAEARQNIPQVSESKTQMCDRSFVTSELIEQTPPAAIQGESASLSHEMETSTLSDVTSVAGTSDVSRIVDQIASCTTESYDDIIMSDIEPALSDIGRSIDHPPSSTMTQHSGVLPSEKTVSNLLGLPAGIAETSQSTIGTTITNDVDEYAGPSLISFQASVPQSNDIVPHSDQSHLSTDGSEEISLLPSSVQSVVRSERFSTLSHSMPDQKSADNYEVVDSNKQIDSDDGHQNSFKKIEQTINTTQPPHCEPPTVQGTYPHTEGYCNTTLVPHFPSTMSLESAAHPASTSSSENTNDITISIDLSDVLTNSSVAVASERSSNEFNTNSHIISEAPTNIPTYSTELHRFTSETSYGDTTLNLTELCRTTPSIANLTEFQVDLTAPTAGQLHTLITTSAQPPLISELSRLSSSSLNSDTDLSVPVLSEEVQNLLNEDTVAANNFEQNDSILRARCSTSTGAYSPAVSVPNFTDLENVNEIAENNNNANIERELQDELGNVLAAAIADRSPNDEADENNVMNENRANFDIE